MVLLAADSLRQREEWLEHLQRAARHLKEDTYITDQKQTLAFAGPSSKVLDTLLRASLTSGKRLVNNLREAKDILGKGLAVNGEHLRLARQLQSKLHDVHANIVALDDGLPCDDLLSAAELGSDSKLECRAWLKQSQTFVLHLQQELELRSKDVCCLDWPDLFRNMFGVFKSALNGVDMDEPDQDCIKREDSRKEPAPRKLCRAVVPRSQLRYSTHWARKIAI